MIRLLVELTVGIEDIVGKCVASATSEGEN